MNNTELLLHCIPPKLIEWKNKIRDYVLKINHSFDSSHQIDHIDRVLINALSIQNKEGGELSIIIPAVLLHDCVPIDKRSKLRTKASQLSATKAHELLCQWGYPNQHLQTITDCIQSHSYSANIQTSSLEAEIVQDADRLDSLGAIGIARAFSLGGKFNNLIYEHNDPFAKDRELNDKAYALDHFYTKLIKLRSTFKTKTGITMAYQRTQFMLAYLDELKKEIIG